MSAKSGSMWPSNGFCMAASAPGETTRTPIIAAIFGKPDFSSLTFTINDSVFRYGDFLNALISFVTVAAAIFFFVVKPMNALAARRAAGQEPEAEPAPTVDKQLLMEIRDVLKAR